MKINLHKRWLEPLLFSMTFKHCQTLCSDCSIKAPILPHCFNKKKEKKNRIRYLRQIVLVIRYLDWQTQNFHQKNYQQQNYQPAKNPLKRWTESNDCFEKDLVRIHCVVWKIDGIYMAEPTNINSCNNVNIVISEIMTIKIIIIGAGT